MKIKLGITYYIYFIWLHPDLDTDSNLDMDLLLSATKLAGVVDCRNNVSAVAAIRFDITS
jgi:hypothetical protein